MYVFTREFSYDTYDTISKEKVVPRSNSKEENKTLTIDGVRDII